jgi:hypothetical protein
MEDPAKVESVRARPEVPSATQLAYFHPETAAFEGLGVADGVVEVEVELGAIEVTADDDET